MEAARLHEKRGPSGIADAIAALQKLQAADEGDPEALAELARLHEATGDVPELATGWPSGRASPRIRGPGRRSGRGSASCGSG